MISDRLGHRHNLVCISSHEHIDKVRNSFGFDDNLMNMPNQRQLELAFQIDALQNSRCIIVNHIYTVFSSIEGDLLSIEIIRANIVGNAFRIKVFST